MRYDVDAGFQRRNGQARIGAREVVAMASFTYSNASSSRISSMQQHKFPIAAAKLLD